MRKLVIWTLVLFSFYSCEKVNLEIEKDKEVILVRKIGDKIMKYAQDSINGLKPVIELGDRTYMLEFKEEFGFVSDSIINIITNEVAKQDKSKYVVKIHSCDETDLVFSYFISPIEDENLVSCMGRNQDTGCYKVEIKFLDDNLLSKLEPLLLLLLIPFVGYLIFILRKKTPSEPEDGKFVKEGVTIGNYSFDYEGQFLAIGGSKVSLTYKESKILRVLSKRLNVVVEREELQKQVWEDDGIMVGRSLDMFISKLRKKLNGDQGVEIKNIHGIGYKLIVT